MIREIAIGELSKLEDAAREFYSASRFLGEFSLDRFCEIWAHLLSSGAGVIFADERGENGTRELAGVIGGIIHPEIYGHELVAEEFFWFVRAEHRGAGVRLYRRFEEWALARGAARLQMVHLFDSMPEKVAKFYLHSGFEPVEMRYQKTLCAAPGIRVIDDFLPDPAAWRAAALALEYKSYTFGETTFHGIALPTSGEVPLRITERFPRATPTLSFFRKSPAGQAEPHFIHTDIDMGEWSAILYLNPEPPTGDGTAFWEHIATGERENPIPHMRSAEGCAPKHWLTWRPWRTVQAQFNRLVMFPSSYFHSRALFNNWGAGDDARLTQVVFGRGEL